MRPQSTSPGRFIDTVPEEGRYRLLVEAVTDYVIYMVDPDGFITSWNPGARRIKGYKEAEKSIGEHFLAVLQGGRPRKGIARKGPRHGGQRG